MITIQKIQIKPTKKQPASEVEEIELIIDFGPAGDAYGGPGDRQIVLLGNEEIESLKKDRVLGLCIDRFVPNISISGSFQNLIKGQKYSIGEAEILISNISKKCHDVCRLRIEEKRICLLPKTARFASILKGGQICINDSVELISS